MCTTRSCFKPTRKTVLSVLSYPHRSTLKLFMYLLSVNAANLQYNQVKNITDTIKCYFDYIDNVKDVYLQPIIMLFPCVRSRLLLFL